MCTDELPFFEWSKKITERLTFLHLNIQNFRDINDDDYFLLEVLHRIWYKGELPFYQTKLDLYDEKAEQVGLFTDKQFVKAKGTGIVYVIPESKTEEK